MKQFDVFENPSKSTLRFAPYLVVLSSHHLLDLDDIVVAPLVSDSRRGVSELEVAVEVDGRSLELVVSELFSLERGVLKKRAGSLADREDDIRRALERLFSGF